MNLRQEKEIKLLKGGPQRTFSHGWAFRPYTASEIHRRDGFEAQHQPAPIINLA
jgi:hypothetical protein